MDEDEQSRSNIEAMDEDETFPIQRRLMPCDKLQLCSDQVSSQVRISQLGILIGSADMLLCTKRVKSGGDIELRGMSAEGIARSGYHMRGVMRAMSAYRMRGGESNMCLSAIII